MARILTPEQKRVRDLVSAFNTPIIFEPGGWGETCPKWLELRVIAERVAMICNGGWDKGTDAEVTCYLYSASLNHPLGGDWTEITLYQASLQLPQLREALPATPKQLNQYQLGELADLKHKIRNSQLRRQTVNRKEVDMPNRKLVIDEQGEKTTLGIMKENTDPILKVITGTLEDTLALIPDFIKEAEEKWAVSPKNPTYKPPITEKPKSPTPAATKPAAGTTPDLPLLSGTGTSEATPAPAPAPEPKPQEPPPEKDIDSGEFAETPAEMTPTAGETTPEPEAGGLVPVSEAIKIAEDQGGSREEFERAETDTTEAGETTPEPAAPQPGQGEATLDESETVATPPAEAPPTETGTTTEDKPSVREGESTLAPTGAPPTETAQPAGQTPGAQTSTTGEWEYFLQDGRGPFTNVQDAMDAMGMDKNNRPQHNRWDRLSTTLKDQIPRKPKA